MMSVTAGWAFIAHPKWSGNVIDDELLGLENYVGIEVFMLGCHVDNNTGYGDIHWDMFSLYGKRVLGFATDDAHSLDTDGGGGWLMVKAKALTSDAILDAIRQGHYYASSGPEIYDVIVENGVVSVECTESAVIIHFMTGGPWGHSYRAQGDEPLTSASYKLRGQEKFVRIEVVDKDHRLAWTNPIYLD